MDDIQSYIDDRCPTIWVGSPPRSDAVLQEAQPKQRHASSRIPSRPTSHVLQDEPRLKPIDGALLRKLYRATMDEKRRAEEKERAARQAAQQLNEDAAGPLGGNNPSSRFYVPGYESQAKKRNSRDVQAKECEPKAKASKGKKKKEKAPPEQPARTVEAGPDRSASVASHKMPTLVPPASRAPSKVQEPTTEEDANPKGQPKPEQGKGEQNQTNKLSKKQKKQQKKAEDEHVKAAAEAAAAIMSGALPAEPDETPPDAETGQWGETADIFEVQPEPLGQNDATKRSASKSDRANLQPTVESAPSSKASHRQKQASRSAHQKTPSPRGDTKTEKVPSFVSWEEVGQGVIGEEIVEIASKIASQKSKSQTPSNHDFEGFDQVWGEPAAEQVVSRAGSLKSRSKASSNHDFEGIDQVWGEPAPGPLASSRRSPDDERKSSSKRSSRSRGWEVEYVHSHHSRSRQSARSGSSKQSANGFGMANDPLLQEDQAEVIPKASASRTKTSSVPIVAEGIDPWPRGGFNESGSRHSSAEQGSKTRSQLTFEEVGEGWVRATPEPVKSGASNRSNWSKPISNHQSQAWQQPASERVSVSQVSHAASSFKAFENAGKAWEGASQEAPISRVSTRAKQPTPSAAYEHQSFNQEWPQPTSEKAFASKATSRHSQPGIFEEIGEYWRDPVTDEIVARMLNMQLRTVSVYERAKPIQDDDEPEHPRSWERQGWDEVEEPQSAIQSFQSFNPSNESSDSGTPLEEMRPTVFAGKGWISPHPLSRSPTDCASPPQSKIVLPSEAFPRGATMSYEEWKDIQEQGLMQEQEQERAIRRNFSPTESHLTVGARRHESRHRSAGWGHHSSDGHRVEEEGGADTSVTGPTSYRVPSMDSERSSEVMYQSDDRPPPGFSQLGLEFNHQSSRTGSWGEQDPAESSERSGRHSRVQNLSEWSHDHSGSKQALDGSEGSHGSRESGQASRRHDSGHSRHHSSRHSSHRTSHQSRDSGQPSSGQSERRSASAQSEEQSTGWKQSSHGSTESRHTSHEGSHKQSRHSSHRDSQLSDRHSGSAQSHGQSGQQQSSHGSTESRRNSHKPSHQRSRHSSRPSTHHGEKSPASSRSQRYSAGWGRFSLGSAVSRQRSHRSSHRSSNRDSRHTDQHPTSTRSHGDSRQSSHRSSRHLGSHHTDERFTSTRSRGDGGWKQSSHGSINSHRSSRHPSSRHSSQSHGRQSGGWGDPTLSPSEQEMEVMEEGRNVWSDIPQYDGTTSMYDRERLQGYIDGSNVSRTPTSRLYLNRYRSEDGESESRWE